MMSSSAARTDSTIFAATPLIAIPNSIATVGIPISSILRYFDATTSELGVRNGSMPIPEEAEEVEEGQKSKSPVERILEAGEENSRSSTDFVSSRSGVSGGSSRTATHALLMHKLLPIRRISISLVLFSFERSFERFSHHR
jgi:hypothetical protein